MFWTILTFWVSVCHAFVFWRGWVLLKQYNWISRRWYSAAAVGTWLLFIANRYLPNDTAGPFAAVLEFAAMTWMTAIFLTFTCLIDFGLITGYGLLFKKHKRKIQTAAFVTGGVLAALALIQGLRPPVVEEYEVYLEGFPKERDGTVVVALSDTHLGSLIDHEWLSARVDQVANLDPDLIVLLGDIVEGHGEDFEKLLTEMKRFSAKHGVYAVYGNHERYGRSMDVRRLYAESDITLLNNDHLEIFPGLTLAGVQDLRNPVSSGNGDSPMAMALSDDSPNAKILLSHRPVQTETAAEYGADLMLAGHTHNGQVWPFTYLVQMQYPLIYGEYDINGMKLIVSRGAGTWGPRMRLWKPGEIVKIVLHGK